ncbi:MAG: SulP family inorganic anion transporter [Velocimicrobium sp.]
MDRLKPKLFSVMKTYSKEQFVRDVVAGIIVAIIALPLSIALALASGVNPERGLYTAIIAGFAISFLGGSRVQISGPTAAFATIVAGIVAENGIDGLIVATILAGVLLIVMGVLKFGSLIKFIPYTITTGFTAGIAVTIFIGQLKYFFGITFINNPLETLEKLMEVIKCFPKFNISATIIGVVSIVILVVWPKINKVVPGSLIAIIVTVLMVKGFKMNVNTIGSLYEISNKLPVFDIPNINIGIIRKLLPDALTIAVLAGVESLLSCVVSDSMVGSRHRSNMELVAQGVGNIFSGLFGGIPATGAIARTAANVKNGGRTPISGMVHSVTLLLILVALMPYAAWIPMPSIAAILFVVAYNMSEWREFIDLIKTSPKSDILVLITTFVLTVVFDLVVAIEFGIVLASLLFIKRMSETTGIKSWKYVESMELEDSENDPDGIELRRVPPNTLVYEINGPLFFAVADKFLHISTDSHINCIILRMRSVPAMDVTALKSLKKLHANCNKNHIQLILSHIQEQPYLVMKKAGFTEEIGINNFCNHIDDALLRAELLNKKQ